MSMQPLSESMSPSTARMLKINLQRLRDPRVLAEAAKWRASEQGKFWEIGGNELLVQGRDGSTKAKAPKIARGTRAPQGKESVTTEVIT